MSYRVCLREEPAVCSACGRSGEQLLWDPTYNLTEIFDLALTGEPLPNPEVSEFEIVLFGKTTDRPRGLRLLDGRSGGQTTAWLGKALERLSDPDQKDRFRSLEPENGWGDLEGAIYIISALKDAAESRPSWVWEVR